MFIQLTEYGTDRITTVMIDKIVLFQPHGDVYTFIKFDGHEFIIVKESYEFVSKLILNAL